METKHSRIMLAGAFLMASSVSITANAEQPDWANASITIANDVCEVDQDGTVAVGKSTFVATSSGEVRYHCNGTLLSEAPAETIRVTVPGPVADTMCKVVITKSGRLIAACRN